MQNALKVTDNEGKILFHLKMVEDSYAANGEESFSDVEIKDIERLFGDPFTSVGVLGSLTKKGLVTAMDVNEEYNIYYLTPLAKSLLTQAAD